MPKISYVLRRTPSPSVVARKRRYKNNPRDNGINYSGEHGFLGEYCSGINTTTYFY